jgi:single-strand DNA-binding protein
LEGNVNSIQLVGRLAADPITRDGDKPVTRFRVAVDRVGVEGADFVPVVCFGHLAEVVGKHLTKGRLVGLTGRINSSRWTTADGENRSALEVIAVSVTFLDRPTARVEPEVNEDLAEQIGQPVAAMR